MATRAEASAPGSGRSLSDLPSDLLVSIFSCIREKPRLRVVSVVCKRWRALTIRSIKQFGTNRYQRGVKVLTSLDTIDLVDDGGTSPLPATLTSLSVHCRCPADCLCSRALHVTGLKQLAIEFRPRNAPPAVVAINNSSSLTSLSISLIPSAWMHADCERDLRALFAASFPHVTHLALSCINVNLFIPFLAALAPQLDTLTLATPGEDAAPLLRLLTEKPPARLRTLHHSSLNAEAHLPALLRSSLGRSLTSLHLSRFQLRATCAAEVLQLAAPILTELEIGQLDSDSLAAIKPHLEQCTRLASLRISVSVTDSLFEHLPVLPSLRALHAPLPCGYLHKFPRLEQARVVMRSPLASSPLASAALLTSIRRLSLTPFPDADLAKELMEIAEKLLPRCPVLEMLELRVGELSADVEPLVRYVSEGSGRTRLCEVTFWTGTPFEHLSALPTVQRLQGKYPWVELRAEDH